jgi:hypothetical protein
MVAQYIGPATDGHLRIVSLWDSKADADRFLNETLGAAVAKPLGPEPSGRPRSILASHGNEPGDAPTLARLVMPSVAINLIGSDRRLG